MDESEMRRLERGARVARERAGIAMEPQAGQARASASLRRSPRRACQKILGGASLLRAYLDRVKGLEPKESSLSRAVWAMDMQSVAIWVSRGGAASAAGKSEAVSAVATAAALGWVDGLNLLLSVPSVAWEAATAQEAGGAFGRASSLAGAEPEFSEIAAPLKHAQTSSAESLSLLYWDYGSLSVDRAGFKYTALGFACMNGEVEAGKILIKNWSESQESGRADRALPPSALFNFGDHPRDPSRVAGWENAVIFALMSAEPLAAKTLALAGGGTPALAKELRWAVAEKDKSAIAALVESSHSGAYLEPAREMLAHLVSMDSLAPAERSDLSNAGWLGGGEQEQRLEIDARRRVAEYLSDARASRKKPAIKDLIEAVLARDSTSTAAWVAAPERWASLGSGKMRDAEVAINLAAAIGWRDGLRLLDSFALGRGGMDECELLKNKHGQRLWAPKKAKLGKPRSSEWTAEQTDAPRRALSALGFAAMNENVEAAKIIVRGLLENKRWEGAFRMDVVFCGPDGPLEEPAGCGANAIIYSIISPELGLGVAMTLAKAGAGSFALADELSWAVAHSRLDAAKMLVRENSLAREVNKKIGQDLLGMAIDKGSAELAIMLLEQGVDSSNFLIHGMPLSAALRLSNVECLAILSEKGQCMTEQDRRALAGFYKEARSPEQDAALPIENQKQEGGVGEAAAAGESVELEGLSAEDQHAHGADLARKEGLESAGGEKRIAVSEAIRELESFEEIVAQMGLRIKELIKGLREQDDPAAPSKTMESELRKMRERAARASQAIAKTALGARREP